MLVTKGAYVLFRTVHQSLELRRHTRLAPLEHAAVALEDAREVPLASLEVGFAAQGTFLQRPEEEVALGTQLGDLSEGGNIT
jgi:hypothetical protein